MSSTELAVKSGGVAGGVLLWALGAWFFVSIGMSIVATSNFRILDPETMRDADRIYAKLEVGQERKLALRYAASELNRHFFKRYDYVQGALALIALTAAFASRSVGKPSRIAIAACSLFVAACAFYFTPTMINQGRVIDFLPRDPKPPEVVEFYRLHTIHVIGEVAKMATLIAVAIARLRAAR